MDKELILDLVKAKEGITTTIRDNYIIHIIKGTIDELTRIKGVKLDGNNHAHVLFVVDYAHYRYCNKDGVAIPRNLQYRLNDLIIKDGGGN